METLITVVLVLVAVYLLKKIVQGDVTLEQDYQRATILVEMKSNLDKKIDVLEGAVRQLDNTLAMISAVVGKIVGGLQAREQFEEPELPKIKDDDEDDGGPFMN